MAQKTFHGITTTTCEECGVSYTSRGKTKKEYADHKAALHETGWYAIRIKSQKLLKERYGNKNSYVHFCKDCKDKLKEENII